MYKFLSLYIVIFCFTLQQSLAQGPFFITNVNIPSLTGGNMLINRTVEINDGKIISISTGNTSTKGTIIDGAGKYLIPGLSEMHAHIPTPNEGDDSNVRETLFLYLANGITTIRGMLGHPYHLELKEQVNANAFPSPRIYTSSPSLNGNTIPSEEDARSKVIQYKNEGYDFLKIHPGIRKEVFDEMVRTANEVGIDFSGHIPADVGIEHAIASGYATIDHLDGYVEGLAPPDKREDGGFFGVLLAPDCDAGKISGLVRATKEAEIAVVPTQTLMTRWLSPKAPELMVQEPEMVYIPAALRFSWRQSKQQMLDRLNYSDTIYDQFLNLRMQLLRQFRDAGVPILLGSDAPQVFNVPGFSIHHEMQSMIDAGLSTTEVLASGTIQVARFFKAADRGLVAEGQVADLVLLSDNPVENISHAAQIEAVIYRGNLLSKDQIEKQLNEIAQRHKTE